MDRDEMIAIFEKSLEAIERHEKNAWLTVKYSEGGQGESDYESYVEEKMKYDQIIKNLKEGKEWHYCSECEFYKKSQENARDNECSERNMAYFDTSKFIFCDHFKKKEEEIES